MHTTRFAPSPTGLLHIGHALAAITASEAAQGGRFQLRIEDLDLTRARPEHEAAIIEDLTWLGLTWQRPVLRQSQRSEAYNVALAALNAHGLVYPCFCTRKEIAAEFARAVEAPHRSDDPLYPGMCRTLSQSEREERLGRGQPFALRLDVARAVSQVPPLTFVELGVGPSGESGVQSANPVRFGDIVLARKDLPAAYHLAVVVDDAFQGVTLVTRGNDLFMATHVQRLLQALLDIPAPQYAHHRLMLDAHGQKFSKRDRAFTLRALRESGSSAANVRWRIGCEP